MEWPDRQVVESSLKTVFHVLPYMAEGGTEKHVLTILRGLQDRYRFVLLAPRGKILDEFVKLNIVYKEFPELTFPYVKGLHRFKERLRTVNEMYGADILHVHAAHEFLIFSRAVLPRTPLIFHLSAHQGCVLSRHFNYALSARISKKKADLLIAVSEEEKRLIIKKGFPAERVEIVYNGYERSEGDDHTAIEEMKKRYGLTGSTVIGNLGRLHRTKRLDILVDAFCAVRERCAKQVKLLFIGDGPDRKRLQGLVRKKGLQDDVVFAGFVRRGDRILKIFDVFVLPTSFEGCSNVLAEAMAKGLPIIATDIPSVRWMFTDGEDGLLFRKNSVEDLSKKLGLLVGDGAFRKRIGMRVLDTFGKRFEARIMNEKIDLIYQRM
jgi:glycosyltransferase involved in cell wall biosynthesis